MATVIWSERAISDLEGIYGYIARDSILYAQYTIHNIFKSTERLQLFPNSGRFFTGVSKYAVSGINYGQLSDNLPV